MSKLTDLLRQVERKDPQLAADLSREYKALSSRRGFGLNFERHSPEITEIPGRQVRKHDTVHVLPPRHSLDPTDKTLWVVEKIERVEGGRVAHLVEDDSDEPRTQIAKVDDLVVVAASRDFIYPGLIETGRVESGAEKPAHTIINGENLHALQALKYTHVGKVDAIYIDPPYNTGARDWKYNNSYVGDEDIFKHSKWLAFMERRLKAAKELLNPQDSVLIVTIDEKEYLHLGMLLRQTFPEARMQMMSSVISQKGSARAGEFSRCNEFIYFVMLGNAAPLALDDDMLHDEITAEGDEVEWGRLKRNGANGRRERSKNLFYPIYLNVDGSFHSTGEPLPQGIDRNSVTPPSGTVAVFPILSDGREMSWGISREKVAEYVNHGYIKFGKIYPNKLQKSMIYYLTSGYVQAAKDGEITMVGSLSSPRWVHKNDKGMKPMTVWNKVSHDAGWHGSRLLSNIIPDRTFPFPKSLYAVEDALKFFIINKPNAIVLDFFAGSGTTAHAVMRLNRLDSGQRQCILVTNNEVSDAEAKKLRASGLRPGDPEWEKWGICDYITKPRIAAAITGQTPQGEDIKGSYKFNDEFPISEGLKENSRFFSLTYETRTKVAHHRAFRQIAPLLWLRAGARGKCVDTEPAAGWTLAETYGVLVDLDASTAFLEALEAAHRIGVVYIVTDDERRFQAVAQRLPEEMEAVRLYESYLRNFQIRNGG